MTYERVPQPQNQAKMIINLNLKKKKEFLIPKSLKIQIDNVMKEVSPPRTNRPIPQPFSSAVIFPGQKKTAPKVQKQYTEEELMKEISRKSNCLYGSNSLNQMFSFFSEGVQPSKEMANLLTPCTPISFQGY